MPVLTLSLATTALVARYTPLEPGRGAAREYVRTARRQRAARDAVVVGHALEERVDPADYHLGPQIRI